MVLSSSHFAQAVCDFLHHLGRTCDVGGGAELRKTSTYKLRNLGYTVPKSGYTVASQVGELVS